MTIRVTIQNEMDLNYKERNIQVLRREIDERGLSNEYILTTLKSGDKFDGHIWKNSTIVLKEVMVNEPN